MLHFHLLGHTVTPVTFSPRNLLHEGHVHVFDQREEKATQHTHVPVHACVCILSILRSTNSLHNLVPWLQLQCASLCFLCLLLLIHIALKPQRTSIQPSTELGCVLVLKTLLAIYYFSIIPHSVCTYRYMYKPTYSFSSLFISFAQHFLAIYSTNFYPYHFPFRFLGDSLSNAFPSPLLFTFRNISPINQSQRTTVSKMYGECKKRFGKHSRISWNRTQ